MSCECTRVEIGLVILVVISILNILILSGDTISLNLAVWDSKSPTSSSTIRSKIENIEKQVVCNERKPILFIHGIMGGKLHGDIHIPEGNLEFNDCKRDLSKRLWVTIDDAFDCTLKYMTTLWDAENEKQYDIPGVNISSPDFGSVQSSNILLPRAKATPDLNFNVLKYFNYLIKKFTRLGYYDLEDMFGASYDWRYYRFDEYNDTNKSYFKENYYNKTAELIKDIYERNQKKVVIISHSMGGLMTYKLLDYVGKDFCDKYIDSWIPISTPWLGSVKAVAAAITTTHLSWLVDLANVVHKLVNKVISKEDIRYLTRRIETVFLLFPISNNTLWGTDPIFKVKSTGEEYKAENIIDLIKTVNDEIFQRNAKYVVEHGFNELLKKHQYKVPHNVKSYCIYSNKVDTLKTIEAKSKNYGEGDEAIYDDGDGTVNIQSLKFCEKMGMKSIKVFEGFDHTEILKKEEVFDYIWKYTCE